MPDLFNTPTIRREILEFIKGLYEAVNEASYGIKFSSVRLGPLGNPDSTKLCVVGIVPGDERKSDLYPLKTSLFDVNIEFSVTANKGDVPGVLVEKFLGVIQQVMYDNDTLGGLVIMCQERRSTIDMFTYLDKTIMGVVTFEVHYRHNTKSVYIDLPTV